MEYGLRPLENKYILKYRATWAFLKFDMRDIARDMRHGG